MWRQTIPWPPQTDFSSPPYTSKAIWFGTCFPSCPACGSLLANSGKRPGNVLPFPSHPALFFLRQVYIPVFETANRSHRIKVQIRPVFFRFLRFTCIQSHSSLFYGKFIWNNLAKMHMEMQIFLIFTSSSLPDRGKTCMSTLNRERRNVFILHFFFCYSSVTDCYNSLTKID